MQALVGVGITAIVSLGIASAVTSGLDGLYHARNISLAEELGQMTSGLLADPNYCSKHFAGKTIPAAVPAAVDPDVTLFELTDTGDLSSTPLLRKNSKYQSNLNIENIKLSVDNKVGLDRYIGSVTLGLKANNGFKISMQRTIPIHISTDSSKKITHCSRVAEPSQGTEIGVWSKTCDDFSAKGWPTKESCLKDGRWHVVYEVESSGSITRGSVSQLTDLINDGAALRVRYFLTGVDGTYDLCTGAASYNGDVACLISQRPGVPDWINKTISSDNPVVYFSNGKVVYNASNANMMAKLEWWAKF